MNKKDRLELEQECLLKYTKAQMIEKYIDELAENEIITEQWYKSQQENQQLKSILTEFEKTLNSYDLEYLHTMNEHLLADNIENLKDILQKLKEKYK